MVVIDASALLEVLLATPAAAAVRERVFVSDEDLHAPHLIDLEVAQVLRRNVVAGNMTEARGREALEILTDLRLTRHAHAPFLRRVWDLRKHVTAYDAVYLALSEALEAPLVTRDSALASVPGSAVTVEVV